MMVAKVETLAYRSALRGGGDAEDKWITNLGLPDVLIDPGNSGSGVAVRMALN